MYQKQIKLSDFHFTDNSIILNHHRQAICFHTYNVKNARKRTKIITDFERGIRNGVRQKDGLDINKVFAVARVSNIQYMGLSQNYRITKKRVIY